MSKFKVGDREEKAMEFKDQFKDLDGDSLRVSTGGNSVIIEAWVGDTDEYAFLAFGPDTAQEIGLALLEAGRRAKRGDVDG